MIFLSNKSLLQNREKLDYPKKLLISLFRCTGLLFLHLWRFILKNTPINKVYFYIILAICIAASILFVQNNDSFYERTIAEVKEVKLVHSEEVTDIYDNEDRVYEQRIIAEITNGKAKGQYILITNQYSKSKAYDYEIQSSQKLFVSIKEKKKVLQN